MRLLGVEPWERRGAQIVKYLAKDENDELRLGAAGALADMRSPEAAAALLDAVAEGRIDRAALGEKPIRKILAAANAKLKERAERLLGK
ncbi:MAG: hypothetical protein HY717_22095 [Planctomycetes bacterium]|nr:hypothetical protein [Planctomycetota bacterium]